MHAHRPLPTIGLAALLTACGGTTPAPQAPSSEDGEEPAAPPRPEPIAEPGFLETWAATGGFELGRPAAITVSPDGRSVLFLRSGPRSFERSLWIYDVEEKSERELMTAEALLEGGEAELSEEEKARRERKRLAARGITRYEVSDDGERLLVPLSGRLFLVQLPGGEVTQLPDEGGYANDAHLSPDGTKVGCVREGDLYVIDVERGRQRRLTDTAAEHVDNGLPEFVAQEEMRRFRGWWWSPDSSHIAYQQTDTSEVQTLYAANPMYPARKPHAAPYPRAGTTNADVRLGVVSVRGGETVWAEWDREKYPYLAAVRWQQDAPLTLLVQNRRQTEQRLLAVDPKRGASETLHVERDEAWLNLDQQVPRWLEGGERFLWTTEREGAWQLELRARSGERVAALTDPAFGYDGLLGVDEERGIAWVAASEEPTETHVWRVPLDPEGGEPERVTDGAGVHGGTFAGDGAAVWVHEAHTMEHGPRFVVRRGEEAIGPLESRAEQPPFEPRVELLTVGERDFRAAVVRPRNFDPSLRYPVIVSVYAGPHVRVVRARKHQWIHDQWIADHGVIVVSADGRGTPGRGREWERAVAGNLADIPLADQIAALEALGERIGAMDLSRVGIVGWSFGGYMSAMAVMRAPEVFHVGVAGAPVADWRDYDTHYTERYMGLPSDNTEGYERSSLLTWAPELERPLLIVHGTSDDNVYFTHAIKLSDALLRAGKPHVFLPLSGFTHMVADPSTTRALQTRMTGFLLDRLRH